MKLCAIYNVWADWDILEYSLKNIEPLVDGVIIVGSTKSNFGEYYPIPENFRDRVAIREPQFKTARESETDKRNFGLDLARWAGFTHFLTIDADEFYDPEKFILAKKLVDDTGLVGLVCTCTTYFKSPTLTIGLDVTLVPFIHELTPTIKHTFNRNYPYAWNGPQIRIDPTRSLNIDDGVFMVDITMHHMSWVRADIKRKMRNSTAKANLERSTILQDYQQAKEGYYCQFYGKVLTRVANRFNIPEVWT